MCRALLYYLAQTWTADPHRQAQRDQPARAARQARHSRPSPSAPGGLAVRGPSDGGCRVASCTLAREQPEGVSLSN